MCCYFILIWIVLTNKELCKLIFSIFENKNVWEKTHKNQPIYVKYTRRHLVTMLIATTRSDSLGPGANGNMDEHFADEGARAEPEPSSNTTEIKTSDVYKVDKNLPARFNNPECFRGYRWEESFSRGASCVISVHLFIHWYTSVYVFIC